MGIDDDLGNKAEDLKGRAQEATGDLTDDPDMQAEGQAEQGEAGLKGKFDDAKDKAQETAEDLADRAKRAVD